MRANLVLRNSTLAMSASILLGSAGTNGEMLTEAALQIAEANEKMMTANRITRGIEQLFHFSIM